ncbi:MAG: hypothetical protein M3Y28_04140 [Armatimonadota bacterium]|nr:hypothetical protein [Armatimonadota bacterium]
MAIERIYALFQDVADAERAIGALQDHGITRDHIGVVARRPAEQDEAGRVRTDYTRVSDAQVTHQGEPAVAYEARPGTLPPAALAPTVTPSSTADTAQNVDTVGKEGITFSTPQDAAAGAAVGGGIGLVTGLLAAAAALAIPGVGIVLSGGILATALGAAAATAAAGAAVGGVAGYLTDMGMPEQAAQNVASRLKEGDYLVTVDADTERYDDIRRTLFKYNAVGVDVNVAAAGETVPPAAVTVPVEAMTDVTPEFVDTPPVTHSVPAPILVPDIMPPATALTPAATTALTAPTPPAPVAGMYDLREAQLVEPVITQPASSVPAASFAEAAPIALDSAAPPRIPADPALAQETEPMTTTTEAPSPTIGVGDSRETEAARIERAHLGEGQDRE